MVYLYIHVTSFMFWVIFYIYMCVGADGAEDVAGAGRWCRPGHAHPAAAGALDALLSVPALHAAQIAHFTYAQTEVPTSSERSRTS